MSRVHNLIRAKIEEHGLEMKALSLAMGRNHAYLHQFLNKGIPQKLDEDDRHKLARLLRVSESELKDALSVNQQKTIAGISPKKAAIKGSTSPTNVSPANQMKVLGMGEGGAEGWNLFNGETVQFIDTPANLRGVPGAYGVYVRGSSMSPRYDEGMIVHIHPAKPVQPGDYVLVQRRPAEDEGSPRAVIKRLVRRSGSKVVLAQINPPKQFDVPAAEIVSIHRIVGSSEA